MNKKTFIERAEEILRSMFVDKDKDNHWGTPEKAEALYQLHIEGVREITNELEKNDNCWEDQTVAEELYYEQQRNIGYNQALEDVREKLKK